MVRVSAKLGLLVFCFFGVSMIGCNEATETDQTADSMLAEVDASNSVNGNSDVREMPDDQSLSDAETVDSSQSELDLGAQDTSDAMATVDVSSMPPQSCERTNNCPFPMVCNTDQFGEMGRCENTTPCSTDADCPEDFTICNPSRMQCVSACRRAQECPSGYVCNYYNCEPGTQCTSDNDCSPNEECEQRSFPGRCVLREGTEAPDMGLAPDGGIWTCEGSQCGARQRCGPHPSSQCEQRTCLGAHGGQCNDQCDCVPPLICRQNTNKCVECLNSLQCDAPDICIATGQCGVRVDLDATENTLPQNLLILQTLFECSQRESFGGCAEFVWTENAPQLGALRREGCDDSTYSGYDVDRASIQNLLSCGGQDSPLLIDPNFSGTDMSGMVCSTRHRGLFWFHNCRAAAVPID